MIPGSANALLLGSAGGYTISRSLRFNSADSAYLSRTPASAGNRKTWTWAGWVKRSALGAAYKMIFSAGTVSTECSLRFTDTPSDALQFYQYSGGGFNWQLATTQVFRDPSAWYHIVAAVDSTQATASSRAKLYVNGVQVTAFGTASYPSLNYDSLVNSTTEHGIGRVSASQYFDGYLADIHFIDGQALDPTSFGDFSATTGVWMPKRFAGTYGTNGFKLDFSDNSAATATTLGKDSSGNGNNWTPNNLSVTAGAGNDSLVDVPVNGTQSDTGAGGEVRGNYATLNPLQSGGTLSNGNLDATSSAANLTSYSTIDLSGGKYYWEVTLTAATGDQQIGIGALALAATGSQPATSGKDCHIYGVSANNGYLWSSNATLATNRGTSTTNDVISCAYDGINNTLEIRKNNVGIATGIYTLYPNANTRYCPVVGVGTTASDRINVSCNFGQRPFAYTAPSGFKALCTANLPAPTIVKPSTVMDVVTYTGNGSTLTPTSTLGFSPDLVWIKSRSAATDHALYDSVRGAQARLESNTTDAEVTSDSGVTAFNTAGFTLGTLAQVNTNAATYAAWTWDAGSSTVTNTAGTISAQVRANASAGFSVSTFTTPSSGGPWTIGHGLGIAPSLIIAKSRSSAGGWIVYHSSIGNTAYLQLYATTASAIDSTAWNNTNTSSSVFTQGNVSFWGSSANYVAYCFAPVAGYSAFGSYTGNGSADGPMVFTNMRPRWIMIKRTDSTFNWLIYDAVRNTYNLTDLLLIPNSSSAEVSGGSSDSVDLVSNGFKIRGSGAALNASGGNYIYACFAESPFSLARAR